MRSKREVTEIIATNLRAARKHYGWSQKEFGQKLEALTGKPLSSTMVSTMETGHDSGRFRAFTAYELEAMAELFNVSVCWFFTDQRPLPPPLQENHTH